MIKHKLINARKEKNKTQNDLADLLHVSQSQYQRREKGEIPIFDNEWVKIAEFLGKEVAEIKEIDSMAAINNYDNQSANYSASNNYVYHIPDFMMKNQQDYIEMLKAEIKRLNEENIQQKAEINQLKEKILNYPFSILIFLLPFIH